MLSINEITALRRAASNGDTEAYKTLLAENERLAKRANTRMVALEKAGLKAVGVNPERDLVEIVELEGHPWFVGCQFHPEFKSRPNRPHPLFSGFVGAAIEHKG